MKKSQLFQIDLYVDMDGPVAYFHRYKGKSHVYRARTIYDPMVKARFIERVHALQLALCKAA